MGRTLDDITDGASTAEQQAAPWIQRFARIGYAAKGVVYTLIAVLALRAAFTTRVATGSRGALETLLHQPFGRVLLAVMGLGLVCFALWHFYRGLRNPESDGVAHRVSDIGTGLIHLGLAATAARFALSGRGAGSANDALDGGTREATASALQQPLGMWLVIGVGGGFIAHALWQFYRAATARLDEWLDLGAVTPARRQWLERAARIGIGARGVVFLMIGVFLIVAALQYDPAEVRDFGGALRALEQQPFGPWLLAGVAAGLLAYGVYEFIRARYRLVRTGRALPQTTIRLKRV